MIRILLLILVVILVSLVVIKPLFTRIYGFLRRSQKDTSDRVMKVEEDLKTKKKKN